MLKALLPPLTFRYSLSLTPFLYLHLSPRRRLPRRSPPPLSRGVTLPRASSSYSHNTYRMESESYTFGPYKISAKEVFYSTQLSYAFVNLRPVVPGMSWCIALASSYVLYLKVGIGTLCRVKIGRQLESYHNVSSLTFTIQDGPQAGQTVPHVHIHILPRKSGDFEINNEIYEAIDSKEKELKEKLNLDKERKDRSMEEMAQEADEYRKLFS
ncbi:Bifunctional bis(5'-adenosyl)-triphosphatase/adenylylsulfatase FHIT [Sesamum alatum]|uniref:Bifunctional bis(5'-adenosyl)-triphosphatase/adenylylsulfatase FHIT n=1 Tax=Sesamum alatum TaxID=300844 RepID=A0AAE1Z2R8_9LAMI|nr:Bifunctional bis(5'-adenosyl)-triphosphatase/adenylylsulfatase FHIT [Sesamum alatum]